MFNNFMKSLGKSMNKVVLGNRNALIKIEDGF